MRLLAVAAADDADDEALGAKRLPFPLGELGQRERFRLHRLEVVSDAPSQRRSALVELIPPLLDRGKQRGLGCSRQTMLGEQAEGPAAASHRLNHLIGLLGAMHAARGRRDRAARHRRPPCARDLGKAQEKLVHLHPLKSFVEQPCLENVLEANRHRCHDATRVIELKSEELLEMNARVRAPCRTDFAVLA